MRVITDILNIRKGPGTSYNIVEQVKKDEVYTITKTNLSGTWGYLKSGARWINITSKYEKIL